MILQAFNSIQISGDDTIIADSADTLILLTLQGYQLMKSFLTPFTAPYAGGGIFV
jgi:hypothetical protein